MTSVSINQPGYLPWMGFFKRIISSDDSLGFLIASNESINYWWVRFYWT